MRNFHLRRGYTFVEMLVVLFFVFIAASIVLPVFSSHHGCPGPPVCHSNLQQIHIAIKLYTEDFDEHYPPLSVNAVASSVSPFARPYGWADAMMTYLRSPHLLQCPEETTTKTSLDATRSGFTDYWFNTNFNAQPTKFLHYPAKVLMCGDGNDGGDATDARHNRNVLPKSWLEDADSPAYRHLDGANYLFADGHVKWFDARVFTLAGATQ